MHKKEKAMLGSLAKTEGGQVEFEFGQSLQGNTGPILGAEGFYRIIEMM